MSISTLKDWVLKNVKENLADIVNYGCASGFPGLTYYSDTVALYDEYEKEIWDMLEMGAAECGSDGPLAFAATLSGAGKVGNTVGLKNFLVWYAVEEIAYQIVNSQEKD